MLLAFSGTSNRGAVSRLVTSSIVPLGPHICSKDSGTSTVWAVVRAVVQEEYTAAENRPACTAHPACSTA